MSPTWYVIALAIVGVFGTLAQCSIAVYGNGLDVSSIVPRFRRFTSTIFVGLLGTATVIVGQFYASVQTFAGSFLTVLVVITTPWTLIVVMGHMFSKGTYNTEDLQVFNRGFRGGVYWYKNGFNFVALMAWIPAIIFGLLFSNTSLFLGPLANTFGAGTGGYLDFVAAAIISLVLYPVLLVLFPRSLPRSDIY
jgi:purine-cytosine permease-like protein